MKSPKIMVVALFLLTTLFAIPSLSSGEEPIIEDLSWSPFEPTVLDPLNVTISLSRVVDNADIWYCIGGICTQTKPMSVDETGLTYSYDYPPDEFENDTAEFHIDIYYDTTESLHHLFNITFREVPEELRILDLEPLTVEPVSSKPGQEFVASGTCIYDIETTNSPKGTANLSVVGSDHLYNVSPLMDGGNFSLSLILQETGSYTLNLSIKEDSYNLSAYAQWTVDVSPWERPLISISKEIEYDPLDAPPVSEGDVFYQNGSVNITYYISNSGTGSANLTRAYIKVHNTTFNRSIEVGNLSQGNRYEGSLSLPTNDTGNFVLNITTNWDQEAPFRENFTFPSYQFKYRVKERPTWEPHRVLVEMFTQSDCVPCVFVEEALERLHLQRDDFEFIIYELGDDNSMNKATARGVDDTPQVFLDFEGDHFRGLGKESILDLPDEEKTEALMQHIEGMINEAKRRDTPPLNVQFTEENRNVSFYLEDFYKGEISGNIEVYYIERFSNRRNNLGIPMSHRFLRTAESKKVDRLSPGEFINVSTGDDPYNHSMVAVFYGEDGNVIQTGSLYRSMEPDFYIKEGSSEILRLKTPGEIPLNITVEIFPLHEGGIENLNLDISIGSLADHFNVTTEDGSPITEAPFTYTLNPTEFTMVTLDNTRLRYSSEIELKLVFDDGVSSTDSLDILIESESASYKRSYVVISSLSDGGEVPEPKIHSTDLVGEGKNIYLVAEASDLPAGADIKGRVIPCMEDSSLCGRPVTVDLSDIGEGRYKGPVLGIDIERFTHLTYSAWIEVDGEKIYEYDEKKTTVDEVLDVEIDGEDEEEDPDPTLLVVAIIITLVLIAGVIVLILVASKKKRESEFSTRTETILEKETTSDEEEPKERFAGVTESEDEGDITQEGLSDKEEVAE